MVELLEMRRLLAADPLAGASPVGIHVEFHGGTLRIDTLGADNTVLISKSGPNLMLSVTAAARDKKGHPIAGRQENRLDFAKVRKIVIHTGAGNDDVRISNKIKADVTVFAGQGSDTVSTGAGADKLYGEDDLDVLVGNLGNDTLDGGAGNDRLTGIEGNDDLWGNIGNDRVTVLSGNHKAHGGPGQDTVQLRSVPDAVDRIERYLHNIGDFVPVHTIKNLRLGYIRPKLDNPKESEISLLPVAYKYHAKVDRNLQSGLININVTAFAEVHEPDTAQFVFPQLRPRVDLGELPMQTYKIRLFLDGVQIDERLATPDEALVRLA